MVPSPLPRTLITLEREEDHEREHDREHRADHERRTGAALNHPPAGARRRTRNLMVTAAVTTTVARTSAATQMRTANYSRRVRGSAARSREPSVALPEMTRHG
jgi:hypothetical protein